MLDLASLENCSTSKVAAFVAPSPLLINSAADEKSNSQNAFFCGSLPTLIVNQIDYYFIDANIIKDEF